MSKANKVQCENGHWYDMNRFHCCPICGKGQGSAKPLESKLPPVPASLAGSVQKTELLDDESAKTPPAAPERGKVGGIGWIFGKKEKTASKEPAQEKPALEPVVQEEPASEPAVSEEPVLEPAVKEEPASEPIVREEPQPEEPAEEEPVAKTPIRRAVSAETRPQPVGSSLRKAVAATGHGITSPLQKTVAFYEMEDVEPPTGWLVCVKGAYLGEALPCKTGRNKIGRNPDCNINVINEPTISREPQAILTYEPKQRVFYLQPGNSDGLVYLNDALLFSHEQLHAYDKIQLGNAEFVFLPLCGEKFNWNDYMN